MDPLCLFIKGVRNVHPLSIYLCILSLSQLGKQFYNNKIFAFATSKAKICENLALPVGKARYISLLPRLREQNS
jgi:hypothetical protein